MLKPLAKSTHSIFILMQESTFLKAFVPALNSIEGKPSIEMMPGVLEKVVPDVFFQDSRHDYEGVTEELNVVAPYLSLEVSFCFTIL
jgi:hypothetical protein